MKLGHSITYYLLNIMNYWRRRVKTACYIYTRVSTAMQVDGYSLDAQKDKLRKYAAFQDYYVAAEYSDEGKSGKSVDGRPEFMRMLRDIEEGKDLQGKGYDPRKLLKPGADAIMDKVKEKIELFGSANKA